MNESVVSLKPELNNKLESAIDSAEGSGWAIYKYNNLYITSHTTKTDRAGSYIRTPDNYNYPKCGLVKLKNEDEKCFKHCTLYHQTKKENHDDRLAKLEQNNNTYN